MNNKFLSIKGSKYKFTKKSIKEIMTKTLKDIIYSTEIDKRFKYSDKIINQQSLKTNLFK